MRAVWTVDDARLQHAAPPQAAHDRAQVLRLRGVRPALQPQGQPPGPRQDALCRVTRAGLGVGCRLSEESVVCSVSLRLVPGIVGSLFDRLRPEKEPIV